MRAKLSILALAIGVALVLSAVLQAAQPPAVSGQEQQSGTSGQSGSCSKTAKTGTNGACALCRVTDVIGREIVDTNQDRLGKIANLAVDHNTGQVRYVVIATEDNRLIPIPWQTVKALAVTKTGTETGNANHCTLNISKETLAKAPNFQEGQWPNFADQGWASSVEKFYEVNVANMAKRQGEGHSK
jgi:sporulation protein YlmC with PRC-barrel domain